MKQQTHRFSFALIACFVVAVVGCGDSTDEDSSVVTPNSSVTTPAAPVTDGPAVAPVGTDPTTPTASTPAVPTSPDPVPAAGGVDPATAPVAAVDRFGTGGMLFQRAANAALPAANAPIDFDAAPFITTGLGPNGEQATYYNFDVQPTAPAPIYVFFQPGAEAPMAGQLNVIDVLPGEPGYNDFWVVHRVDVPADYVANSVTSLDEITAAGFTVTPTETIVNCPVVPDGSTASLRVGEGTPDLISGWYKGQIAKYFEFGEAPLSGAAVPTSPIYVMFNVNPDAADPASGPASGFRAEDSGQTHNVLATLPGDAGYSPLWAVNILDNMAFDAVGDLASAAAAPSLAAGPNVNCPVVDLPGATEGPIDPAVTPVVEVDRFSATAGTLFNRDAMPTLPAANAPIDFDANFYTVGLGPAGQTVSYYNFDVQPTAPAPIFVFFEAGSTEPVPGQLNVIDVLPGEVGYNDFWIVYRVEVPVGYVANTLTSAEEITASGYPVSGTETMVNCPVVPDGSTASKRVGGGSAELVSGWYKGQVVKYFEFGEAPLSGTQVPLSPIYVMFNANPDDNDPESGPPSGFRADPAGQTHNVLATVPGDAGYSPLWSVNVLDNTAFDAVTDLSTATAQVPLASDVANVNCPVGEVAQ